MFCSKLNYTSFIRRASYDIGMLLCTQEDLKCCVCQKELLYFQCLYWVSISTIHYVWCILRHWETLKTNECCYEIFKSEIWKNHLNTHNKSINKWPSLPTDTLLQVFSESKLWNSFLLRLKYKYYKLERNLSTIAQIFIKHFLCLNRHQSIWYNFCFTCDQKSLIFEKIVLGYQNNIQKWLCEGEWTSSLKWYLCQYCPAF